MMQQPFSNIHFSRRLRKSMRDVTTTMLLTAAGFGILMAVLYGGGMPKMESVVGSFETKPSNAEKSDNQHTTDFKNGLETVSIKPSAK